MNDFVDSFAYWLADYYLATTVLFAAAVATLAWMKQPAKRMAVVKGTLLAAVLLIFLCALPGWSVVHLATTAPKSPRPTATTPIGAAAPSPPVAIEAHEVLATVPADVVMAPEVATAPAWSPSWLAIMLAVYALGSAAVLLRLALGVAFARRLLGEAAPAPVEVDEVLTTVLAGERSRPELRVSRRIDVAAALGILRPTVLLPNAWAMELSPSELRTVLAHECAHVRNGDLKWLAISRLVSVALWLLPLYWLVRRRMRLDQETLADAAAAELSSRVTYAEQLVKWARAVPSRPRPALASAVGLWESPSQLRRRVAVLLDEHFPVLRECSRSLRWSSLLVCGLFAIALSAITFQPTLSEPTDEATIPDRLVVGDRYVLCNVTTDLQQTLLANDSWPHAEAAACLLVNFPAFTDEKLDAESPVLKELSATLAKWAKVDNSRLIARVYVKPNTDDEAAAKARKRAGELAKRLQQLGNAAGYRQSICGVTYLADLSFDWQQFVSDAESLSANSTPESENGIGNDRVKVFAVNTFLSRLLVTADCVVDIVPVLQSADAESFPQAFQASIDELVPQLKYVRQDEILLWIRCPMSIREGIDAWVDDTAGRKEYASELGFKNCNLSTDYVAEPETPAKAEDATDRTDSPVAADVANSKPDSSGGITHDPLGLPVAEDELVGVVLDEAGQPLADVKVDVWTWYPGNEVQTDKEGRFKLKGFEPHEQVQVKFSKAGYCPKHRAALEVGRVNWIVTLDNRTYLEGRVTGRDGKPVAGAKLQATRGPFENPQVQIGENKDETVTDADGKYRIYLEPDTYDIQMRVAGAGMARRSGVQLRDGEHLPLEIELKEGPKFRAVVRDSVTNEPVAGIRLWNWQRPGIDGVSNAEGVLEISNMPPGAFEFQVAAANRPPHSDVAGDYARWWSPEALKEWQRLDLTSRGDGFQRNFDHLEFEIREGMEPVTIFVERAVTIRGQVVDPDGKPVAGATAAPAKTGSGNSLTGDTRYSVPTGPDGKFEMRLPASGAVKYNLVAHDGKYEEWRRWANGVGELLQTKPGDELEGVTLRLSQPCVVGGRVLDAGGKPVANHPVRAHAADKMESRYYDPTTKTNERGEFVLKFVRPGKHYIQADPFWLTAEQGPAGGWKLVDASAEKPVDGVELRLGDDSQPSSPLGATLLELRAKADEIRAADEKPKGAEPASPAIAQQNAAATVTVKFVASPTTSPWDYKPNVLAFAVQDEKGAPVEGVEAIVYRVTPQDGELREVRRGATNPQGEVELAELMEPKGAAAIQEMVKQGQMPNGVQSLFYTVLRQDGLATVILPVSDFSLASRGAKRQVRMRPAAELRGRVIDHAGKPVEGALVAAGGMSDWFAVEGINAARSDGDGRYRITNLPAFNRDVARQRLAEKNQNLSFVAYGTTQMFPAVYDPADDLTVTDLRVTHPDFAVTTHSGGDVPGTSDVVMAPAAAIEGRVVEFSSGEPAAGVHVELFGDLSAGEGAPLKWHTASTRTDAAGAYRFGNLPEGKYEVWAEEVGSADDGSAEVVKKRVSRGIKDIAAVGGAAATRAGDLVMGPGGLIHGRLIDATTGKPITGSDGSTTVKAVTFVADAFRRQQESPRRIAVDREGRFDLQVVPGKRRVLLFVFAHGADSDPQGDYRSADDTFDVGQIFELQHGESTEADFQVWPKAKIEEMRAKVQEEQAEQR
jgi:beta-lactamase regulating signal transducer with metallopeptidase domain/protocatechuate 3,4-dioxygenase beta subunit